MGCDGYLKADEDDLIAVFRCYVCGGDVGGYPASLHHEGCVEERDGSLVLRVSVLFPDGYEPR